MWGATLHRPKYPYRFLFQSTHPCGVRLLLDDDIDYQVQFQSTHPGGVRHGYNYINDYSKLVSIHAPVWGATIICSQSINALGFQSTHPCGVRPRCLVTFTLLYVSIHAPVWGATQLVYNDRHRAGFNPRTRVGCDSLSCN